MWQEHAYAQSIAVVDSENDIQHALLPLDEDYEEETSNCQSCAETKLQNRRLKWKVIRNYFILSV